MEHPRLVRLRERTAELRRKEKALIDELYGFAERDKAATRAAIRVVCHDLWDALMEVAEIRKEVEDLQDGRRLGEIFELDTLETIVACEQRILTLYGTNVGRMRELMQRKSA